MGGSPKRPSPASRVVEKRMKKAREKEASVAEEGATKSPVKDREASLGEHRQAQ